MLLSDGLLLAALGVVIGLMIGAIVGVLIWRRGRRGKSFEGAVMTVDLIAERVRAAGKLIGLEVCAKEIATAKKGWDWLPPLLLSPARLAMIFKFEKQYFVDLNRVSARDVTDFGERRYQLILPPIEGQLRLTDVTPYDIQDGKVCGLLDVIQMKAEAQGELMKKAQEQAAILFESSDLGYVEEARNSVQKQLSSLLALFDAEVDIIWKDQLDDADSSPAVVTQPSLPDRTPQPSLPDA